MAESWLFSNCFPTYPLDTSFRAHGPFPLVVSNLALHYIENLETVFQKVHRTLKPAPRYWPIDNYFIPGERITHFLGCDVVKQHHTFTQILMGLLNNGFALEAVEEAKPPEEMMHIPGMKDELRRPMMLLVKAGKK